MIPLALVFFFKISRVAELVKNLPSNVGDAGDVGLIPGLGRFPGVGNGNPLQYSCLENSMDREVWWAIVQFLGSQSQSCLSETHTLENRLLDFSL